jgi:isocitrate dehydrogenase
MYNKLVGIQGEVLFEANHGTIPRHFFEWQMGKKALSNPIATIYTWTEGLRYIAA